MSNKTPFEGVQGFYILDEAQKLEKLDIHTISDDTLKALDSDSNGLAEYWPGDPSWHAPVFNRVKLKSFQLSDKFEELNLSSDEFIASLEERRRNGIPTLFYYWEPDWIHAKYALNMVNEPGYKDGCRDIVDPSEGDDWFDKSKFECAFPVSQVWVVFRDDFLKHDILGPLLINYTVDVPTLEKALLKSRENGQPIKEIVFSQK